MNFTAQEMRLVERLRKQDRQWRWARWLVLGLGIFSVGLCAVFGYFLHSLVVEAEGSRFGGQEVFIIVLIWTKCCFYFTFGGWCLITAFLKWHGDVNRMLMLRLLDAQQ